MGFPDTSSNPTLVNDVAKRAVLGSYASYKGKIYQYVQFKDAVTYVAGQGLSWDNQDGFQVTNDITSMEATTVKAAGVCMRVMTENYYGYMLVLGYHASVAKKPGVDTWTADDLAILSSDTDGAVDVLAFGGTTVDPTSAQLLVFAKQIDGALGQVAGVSDDTADTVPVHVRTI